MNDYSLLSPNPVPRLLLYFVLALGCVELILTMTDVMGAYHVRNTFIVWLGLWPGIVSGVESGYPGQAVVMLGSYAILHGDMFHYIFNAMWLLLFGRVLLRQMSFFHFQTVLWSSVLVGALFVLVAGGFRPVVGISGGVYGLGALWAIGFLGQRFVETNSWRPVVGGLAVIVAVVLIIPALTASADVSWEAHLGGAVVGIFWGAFMLWKHPPMPSRKQPHLRVME